MKRIFGARTCVDVILHAGLVLGVLFLCLDVASGDERRKSRGTKGKEVAVEPKKEGAEEEKKAKKGKTTGKVIEGAIVGVVANSVKGVVSGISPRFIVVTYAEEIKDGRKVEYDIHIPIKKDTSVVDAGGAVDTEGLDKISVGDTVTVGYEEEQGEYRKELEDGTVEQGVRAVSRKATRIKFIKSGKQPKGVYASE